MKKQRILLAKYTTIVLSLLLLGFLVVWVLWNPHHQVPLQEYLFENNAAISASFQEGQTSQLEDGVFSYQISKEIQVKNGEGDLLVENPQDNRYYMRVFLLEEDGTLLFASKLLKPGYSLQKTKFSQTVPSGIYAVTAVFTAYDIQTLEAVGETSCPVTLHVA